MIAQKLTLKEIAAIYKVTPKTFKKITKDKQVPHEIVGREMRFVLSRVEACLTAVPEILQTCNKPTIRHQRKVVNLFTERVGI